MNMVLVDTSQKDEFFGCHSERLNLRQIFLLPMWSITTWCLKVAQLIQTLVGIWLAHFFNHPPSIPPPKIGAQPTQIALHHNQKLPI